MTEFQLLTTTRYDPFLRSLQWNNANEGADPSSFFLLPMHFARLVLAAEKHGWADDDGNSTSNSNPGDDHGHLEQWLKYDVLKVACTDAVWEQQRVLEKEERATAAFRVRITVSKNSQITVIATGLPVPFTSDPTVAALVKPNPSSPSFLYSDIAFRELGSPPITPLDNSRPVVILYLDSDSILRSQFTETKTTLRDVYDRAKARVSFRVDAGIATGDWDVILYDASNRTNATDEESGKEMIMETSIFNIAFFRLGRWLTPSAAHTGCLPGVMRRFLLETKLIEEDQEGELTKQCISANECVLLFNGVQGCRLGKICAEKN